MEKIINKREIKKEYKKKYKEKFQKKYEDKRFTQLIDIFGTVIGLETIIIFIQLFLIFYMYSHNWTMVIM